MDGTVTWGKQRFKTIALVWEIVLPAGVINWADRNIHDLEIRWENCSIVTLILLLKVYCFYRSYEIIFVKLTFQYHELLYKKFI